MSNTDFIPKIIFFDIDDTLSRNGVLDPINQALLEALAQTDVKVVIATGRPKPFLPDDVLALFDAGIFDAIICTNGQYNFKKDGIISHYPLTPEQTDGMANLCETANLVYKFDSAEHLAWASIDDHFYALIKDRPHAVVDKDYRNSHTVYQCSVFFTTPKNADEPSQTTQKNVSTLDADALAKQSLKLVMWHHMGGDILPVDASKARAVQDVCDYFNISVNEAMAFGDGFNDIEMFKLVGHAVAMGDAEPSLKEHANQVTGTIEEGGIETVIKEFGLI